MELPLTVFHNDSVSQNCVKYWAKTIFVLKPVQNKHLCLRYTIEILFSLTIWVSQAQGFSPSMIAVVNTGFPRVLVTELILSFNRVLEITWRWSELATSTCDRKYFFFSKLFRVQHKVALIPKSTPPFPLWEARTYSSVRIMPVL